MNMAMGRVGVLTSTMDWINVIKEIKVDGFSYNVRITEDQFESIRLMPSFPAILSSVRGVSDNESQNSDGFRVGGCERLSDDSSASDSPFQSPVPSVRQKSRRKSPKLAGSQVEEEETHALDFEVGGGVPPEHPAVSVHQEVHSGPTGDKNKPTDKTNRSPSSVKPTFSIDLNKSVDHSIRMENLHLHRDQSDNPNSMEGSTSAVRIPSGNSSTAISDTLEGSTNQEVLRTISIRKKVGFAMDGFEVEVSKIVHQSMAESVSDLTIRSYWGNLGFESVFKSSQGRSGGLISVWDKQLFSCESSFTGDGFLVTIGWWQCPVVKVAMVNIYAPQQNSRKRKLWADLLSVFGAYQNLIWVLFGDFNEVREEGERLGSRFSRSGAKAFNDFIINAGLSEIRCGGRRFTRFSSDGLKLSKLDHILVSHSFFSVWVNPSVEILPRVYSDHCPLFLSSLSVNFGPLPFKFFNSWLSIVSLDEVVVSSWSSSRFSNPSANAVVRLVARLKHLRNCIKSWKANQLHDNGNSAVDLRKNLNNLESLAESSALSDSDKELRLELIQKIFDIEKKNLLDIKQKARINWAINGDENSKYFHSSLKYKQRKNHIHGLSLDGDWITDPLKLKSLAFDFFADKYKEPLASRPSFICQRFKKLSELQKEFLEGQFTEAEIKKAVWGCDGDKAQGPDGFTFSFIKKFWFTIGQGFVDAVNHFGNSKKLDKCANSSFLSLIPKIRDPIYLLDYRPISLIGCLYKIIAKVLSNRLKEVISSVIGVEQTAFLKNRSILDGPLIINETISWIKRSKKKAFILKVDFQKAFDTLNWNYLDMVMGQMNFGSTWRAWIHSCLDSSRVSVLVNGSPSHEFSMFRGIRQGDPLAPFLFLIAAEGLNVALLEAIDGNVFQGINLPHGGPIISHLQYADDAIFIGNWSEDNALNLLSLLRCFYMSSGLMVNLSKTVLMGVGVNSDEVVNLANLLNCSSGSLPFNYLGLPVGASMNKCSHWQPILDKFQSKLSSWKASLLSCGGRITLCKSVLGALGVYYFSLYKAPIKVINTLESFRCHFFWGGDKEKKKICWMSWKDVISPMEFGGLGVGSLRSLNLALLAKWWWRLKTDRAALWNKVIFSLHGYKRSSPADPLLSKKSGAWSAISSVNSTLVDFNLDLNLLIHPQYDDSSNEPVSWRWDLEGSGLFSVSSLRMALENKLFFREGDSKTIWLNPLPSKVNIFIWKLQNERLPTLANLSRRGINLPSLLCHFCGLESETEQHLFCSCPIIRASLEEFRAWWGVRWPILLSIKDLLRWGSSFGFNGSKLEDFLVALFTWCWSIWNLRNDKVFGGNAKDSALLGSTQSNSFLWLNSRRNSSKKLSWYSWCICPMEL
ncbi:hypothetical protein OSB04_022051 [Centaurea solstitialis]|uniref:Reverse transcriptase domain-containing protein n=1 Tax=Centaurea solstitialis TaxID=347529 RepID=A0AA38SVM1_9ASTR|nr:hypothetical protein OSB04_022051 [Centaurea solstitialis]